MNKQRILILGASGYIGQHLTPRLSRQGYSVTAAARRIEWLQQQNWPGVTCRYVDLLRPETLPSALIDIDVVYYLVHGMGDGAQFVDLERQAANHLRDALQGSQVREIIFLSALQPDSNDPHVDHAGSHLQARRETGMILGASGIPLTELRASIIIGPGSAAFEVMRDMIYNLPILTPPRWVRSKTSPIALENLLYYLTELLKHPASDNRLFDTAGPEYLSYQEMFSRFIAISGKRRLLIPIPLPTRLISIYWLNLVTSVPTTIAKALIEGLKYDLPADDLALRQLIPQPLISYQEAVMETLRQEQQVVDSAEWGYDPEVRARWRPGYGFYPKQAGYTLNTTATSETLWRIIQRIGGEEGYFYANSLWRIRAWMDDLWGKPTRYGRPSRESLQVGDQIDSWKVLTIQPQHQITLLFGMKAPGLGRLTFTITELDPLHRQLDVRAWWHPAGFSGLLYWFIMMPAHLFIFKGMARRIANLAKTVAKNQ